MTQTSHDRLLIIDFGSRSKSGHGTAEFGRAYVTPNNSLDILDGWFADGDEQGLDVPRRPRQREIAQALEVYGTSPNAPYAITADTSRHSTPCNSTRKCTTQNGAKLYENFVKLAGFKGDWTMGAYRAEMVEKIKPRVGDKKVICALSGGVDRLCRRPLLHEAIGDQLTCVFVEPRPAAQERSRRSGQSDPETKRKIIGKLFIDVFQKYADQIEGAEFLAQGTLYPDVIDALHRPSPFPGPGLPSAARVRSPARNWRSCAEADAIYIDQIRKHGLYDDIWQAFVAILPVRTVGVMGDGRTYDYACALRAVTSVDGMTADYYPFSHEFLGETATDHQ
ncbi:hypothetical protein AAFF_G00191910 [Aldrovandia affinis]|uniref:GMP synthase C-terminal domain-containing protein n=1 Tax=Aldrovandia affinis TaxID=143900 RepID=A0AAD7VWL2_9TELE|nr:hypothetical protein AAFF_G00191910 [Aldrovandia affinis]